MRIGILGGTFDPVHNGHLDVARAASRALALDEIWLMPCRVPPHRSAPHASASHRFAMAALATAVSKHWLVSDLEMTSEAPWRSASINGASGSSSSAAPSLPRCRLT